HFWLVDDLYAEPYGRAVLNNLSGTPQYLSWITKIVRPFLGDTVFEMGAGIGNLSGRLMAKRLLYVAAENNDLYLHSLHNRFLRTPNVRVVKLDPVKLTGFDELQQFDTVLAINVLEYLPEPEQTIAEASKHLRTGGRMVVLAPQGKGLFCH